MAPFTSLLVASVLLVLPPIVQAASLFYADRIAVYDATGRQVGSTWPKWWWEGWDDVSDVIQVEFRLGTIPVQVNLTDTTIETTRFMRFSGPGCTGRPLVDVEGQEELRVTAVLGPRRTVYVQSGPGRLRTARSTRAVRGDCLDHGPLRGNMFLLEATDVHLSDHFVPPFTLEAQGRTRVPRRAP
jgi:hypothetical protein